jgi:hypothetical protein
MGRFGCRRARAQLELPSAVVLQFRTFVLEQWLEQRTVVLAAVV